MKHLWHLQSDHKRRLELQEWVPPVYINIMYGYLRKYSHFVFPICQTVQSSLPPGHPICIIYCCCSAEAYICISDLFVNLINLKTFELFPNKKGILWSAGFSIFFWTYSEQKSPFVPLWDHFRFPFLEESSLTLLCLSSAPFPSPRPFFLEWECSPKWDIFACGGLKESAFKSAEQTVWDTQCMDLIRFRKLDQSEKELSPDLTNLSSWEGYWK